MTIDKTQSVPEFLKDKVAEQSQTISGEIVILAERYRQIKELGYSISHDCRSYPSVDNGFSSNLAKAANSYEFMNFDNWPWASNTWNPSENVVRNLIKAGALYLAEIDRLDYVYNNGDVTDKPSQKYYKQWRPINYNAYQRCAEKIDSIGGGTAIVRGTVLPEPVIHVRGDIKELGDKVTTGRIICFPDENPFDMSDEQTVNIHGDFLTLKIDGLRSQGLIQQGEQELINRVIEDFRLRLIEAKNLIKDMRLPNADIILQELFEYLSDELGAIALHEQMCDIMHIVYRAQTNSHRQKVEELQRAFDNLKRGFESLLATKKKWTLERRNNWRKQSGVPLQDEKQA